MNFNSRKYFISSVTIVAFIQTIRGSHILALFPFGFKSHMIYYESLITSFASRGHNVTVFSPVEIYDRNSSSNVTQIVPAGLIDSASVRTVAPLTVGNSSENISPMKRTPASDLIQFLIQKIGKKVCDFFLQTKELEDLLHSKNKYDVVIIGNLFNECALPVVHILNVPYIAIISDALAPELEIAIWNPVPWLYVPNFYLWYRDDMNFWDHSYGFFSSFSLDHIERTFYPALDKIIQRHLGPGMPSIMEMKRNASLVFVNSDPSMYYLRPNAPSIIRLEAIHIKPAHTLPKDLQQFLNDSGKDGFVVFSLGSLFPEVNIPQGILEEFVKAFSMIPQRVVWSWKGSPPTGLTPNVKLVKWFPQQDLLGHPEIRAFITHGGLKSTQEAIYHGVPMLGLPVFPDQSWNVRRSVVDGYAINLDITNITADKIEESLEKLTNDPIYKFNIRRRQRILKDKPVDPVELGVYWTEYVIRHEGAHHLRTAALNPTLSWYHENLVAFLVVAIVCVVVQIMCVPICYVVFGWY